MLDMPDLVAENGFDFVGRQLGNQTIGEDDVADPGDEAGDQGVGEQMTRVPDEYVAVTEILTAG